ncbi:MAG: T9SS type A sorting domain-containing protein [Candidatus Cloacimonetes bacterium]|nr:T9SS type A sorting domain-containing protein [Candidatus Cloacimonadota bacterium]
MHFVDFETGWAVGYNGTIAHRFEPSSIPDEKILIPSHEVTVHQNYPNPFNPTTTINYSLKENSKVSLNIYNIKGQKVKQLVSDQFPSGQYSVIWNGTDDNNKSVSSGIYFYKLKSGDFEKTKKMLLMK